MKKQKCGDKNGRNKNKTKEAIKVEQGNHESSLRHRNKRQIVEKKFQVEPSSRTRVQRAFRI